LSFQALSVVPRKYIIIMTEATSRWPCMCTSNNTTHGTLLGSRFSGGTRFGFIWDDSGRRSDDFHAYVWARFDYAVPEPVDGVG
jgi:hypothetical protein